MRNSTKIALGAFAVGVGVFSAGRALWRRSRRVTFENQRVLITGGSRGLGLVLARQLAREGAEIHLCGRDADQLERAGVDLAEYGTTAYLWTCDITDAAQVGEMIEQLSDRHGPVEVLINNAGIIQSGPWEAMTDADFEEAMGTHLRGPQEMVEAVLPGMRVAGGGRIMNIASIGGLISLPHLLPYCTSKFALVGYSLGLRTARAREGIVVTTVCPGLMRTGSPRQAYFKGKNREEYAWFKIASSLPLVTLSADRAASQALDACRDGEVLRILGYPAKIAALFTHCFPQLAYQTLTKVHELLPRMGGIGTERRQGAESQSAVSESWLTELTDRAAHRNLEK